MNSFIFTKKSRKALLELSKIEQNRILDKLTYLKSHPNIISVVKALEDMYPITHRLRIGNFRLLLHLSLKDKDEYEFIITQIAHRKDVYR